MTSREFYLERRNAELPAFLSVLRSLPGDRMDYRPHDRSPSATQLVWTLTTELRSCVEVVKDNRTSWRQEPVPALAEMLRRYEEWSKELIELVGALSEDAWDRVAQFYYQEKVVSEQPVGQFLWFILFDGIHHRGQLSAYLRPMGGSVPAIYGPSADSRSKQASS